MIWEDEITPELTKLLTVAGWFPERHFDATQWMTILQDEGFKGNPAAQAILESFGGLSVHLPPAGINPYPHELRFDPLRAASGEADRAEGFYDAIGIYLFPIGEEVGNNSAIWVGDDGQFYIGMEFGLYHLGKSFGLAMHQLAFPMSPLAIVAN